MNAIALAAGYLIILFTYNQLVMHQTTRNGIVLNVAKLRLLLQALALPVLIVIISTRTSVAASIDLSDDEMRRLQRGEILLQTIQSEKPGAAARVTALFHGNIDSVWDIIGSCKYEFIYLRGLKVCEMLEGDQYQMTMHHRLRNSWYTPILDFTFKAKREPGGDGYTQLLEGDLKVFEGHWQFIPLTDDNGLIVVHQLRIQPKIPAPKWLVRRSLRNDLPDMLACIRGLAGASGDKRHIEDDLQRCPGNISEPAK